MTFLHLSLLAGLAAIAVPIGLHLFGQRQPQLIDFPALRFVKETSQEQSTSWQLRHILLLLLRVLVLAAMALALTRPRVHSAALSSVLGVSAVGLSAAFASVVAAAAFASKRPTSVWMSASVIAIALWCATGIWGYQSLTTGPKVPPADQSAPVAVAMIIDNGPTMAYRSSNEARLETAKEHGLWVLEKLPIDSRVGILSGAPVGSLALDPASAKQQIKLLETRGAHIDLLSRLRTALDLVIANELQRKEIYVITDLMSASWASAQPGLRDMLDEYGEEVLVQVIDVGAEDQSNWSLGDPEPELTTIAAGGDLEIEISVNRSFEATGDAPVTVELWQEEIDPRLPIVRGGELVVPDSKVVDRQVVDLATDTSRVITLTARNLAEGTHHFTIRLEKADPLDVDNQRFISIVSRPPQPTLVVVDNPKLETVLPLIVDPEANMNASDGLVQRVSYSQLGQVDLSPFAVLWLHDPPPMTDANALNIRAFVARGGGLLTVLGPGLGSAESLGNNPIVKLLPGKLSGPFVREKDNRSAFMTPIAKSHPMFQSLGEAINDEPWLPFPIFVNWTFANLSDASTTVMQVSDNAQPIVVSESVGNGQILTLTTPLPQVEIRNGVQWNELWIQDDSVFSYLLLLGALDALNGANQDATNYSVATPVTLKNNSQTWPTKYQLFKPKSNSYENVTANDDLLSLGAFESEGVYRLRGVRGAPVARGFSINAPAADTQLERVLPDQLDEQLGSGNYKLARSRNEVESSIGQARFGRELYPLLMVFVAGLFLAEQAMSNRFYKLKFRKS